MKQFEYTTSIHFQDETNNLIDMLNNYGKAGWQVVNMRIINLDAIEVGTTGYTIIFMREKPPTS